MSAADTDAPRAEPEGTALARDSVHTGVTVDVRRGSPTDEELAAVVAVVTETYERESAAAVADDAPLRSPWEITARALRQPLPRGIGWGRFTG